MSVAGSPTESRQTFTRSDEYVGDRVVIPLKPFFVASNLVPHRRAIEELKRSEPLAFPWTNDGQAGSYDSFVGLVPANALVLSGRADSWIVDKTEVSQKRVLGS